MKPAIILYGPSGCGKTTWIKQEAKARNYRVFRWNVRNDRSLREGREVLHAQVRSQERTLIWIEGADDLTPESQAFLRRILETASHNVQCILECRDPQRITPAIQSRCEWKQCGFKKSFRREQQRQTIGNKLPARPEQTKDESCRNAFQQAEQPADVLKGYLKDPSLWEDALLSLKAVGSGSSPWAHMYYMRAVKERIIQSKEA